MNLALSEKERHCQFIQSLWLYLPWTDIVRTTAADQILLLRTTPQDRALGHKKSGWPEIRYENLLFPFQLYTPVAVPGYKVVPFGSL